MLKRAIKSNLKSLATLKICKKISDDEASAYLSVHNEQNS